MFIFVQTTLKICCSLLLSCPYSKIFITVMFMIIIFVWQTFEGGHRATDAIRRKSEQQCAEQGGLSALRVLYPWHSYFRRESREIYESSQKIDEVNVSNYSMSPSRRNSLEGY